MALDTNSIALINAGNTLLAHLQSAGCKQAYDQTVADFQNAYVTAGGSLKADGYYGSNTQTALQTVLNNSGDNEPQQAPAGCVSAAPVTPVNPVNPPMPAPSGTPVNPIVWAVLGVVLVGGAAAWAYKHKKGRKS